jgi:hypothetical protein
MENPDNIDKKLDKADRYLTKFGIILKKHWSKILLLLFCYFVWCVFSQPIPKKTENNNNNNYPAEGGIYDTSDTISTDTVF